MLIGHDRFPNYRFQFLKRGKSSRVLFASFAEMRHSYIGEFCILPVTEWRVVISYACIFEISEDWDERCKTISKRLWPGSDFQSPEWWLTTLGFRLEMANEMGCLDSKCALRPLGTVDSWRSRHADRPKSRGWRRKSL